MVAASLNGCYGYLHTRFGAPLRLAVLLSLVRSPHFLPPNRSFSLAEVWGVTKGLVGGRGRGRCVCVCVWDDGDDDDAWKRLGEVTLQTVCRPLCHDDGVFADIQELVAAGEQGNGKKLSLFRAHWTQDKQFEVTRSNCAVNHNVEDNAGGFIVGKNQQHVGGCESLHSMGCRCLQVTEECKNANKPAQRSVYKTEGDAHIAARWVWAWRCVCQRETHDWPPPVDRLWDHLILRNRWTIKLHTVTGSVSLRCSQTRWTPQTGMRPSAGSSRRGTGQLWVSSGELNHSPAALQRKPRWTESFSSKLSSLWATMAQNLWSPELKLQEYIDTLKYCDI